MGTWFKSLLLLAVAVTVAVLLRRYEGDVLVLLPDVRIQLPLARAVFIILLTFVVLYVLLRLTSWTLAIPQRLRDWRQRRIQKRDLELLEQGWINYLEGRYAQAEKSLTALLDQARVPRRKVLAALSAARAADALGEFGRRDGLLQSALEQAEGDENLRQAVLLVGADMLLTEGRPAEALARMAPLQDNVARHLHAQRLFLKAHHALGNYDQSFALARALSRRGVLGREESRSLLGAAVAARLSASQGDNWRQIWKDLKSSERLLPDVALAGARCFTQAGQPDDAAKVLEAAIADSYDARLIEAYSHCEPAQVSRRLEKAEKWLERDAPQADLLRAVGTLCLTGQLWGPAERYLTRSLQVRNDPRTHVLLGSLYDSLNRRDEALRHWRLASQAALGDLPQLEASSALPAADTRADPQFRDAEDSFGTVAKYPVSKTDEFAADGLESDAVYVPAEAASAVADDAVGSIEGAGRRQPPADAPIANAPGHADELDQYFDSAPLPYPVHEDPVADVAPATGKDGGQRKPSPSDT